MRKKIFFVILFATLLLSNKYYVEAAEMTELQTTEADEEVPELRGLSFEKNVLAGEKFEVTVDAVDASGIEQIDMVFYNQTTEIYIFLYQEELTFSETTGKYTVSYTIPAFHDAGTYMIDAIGLTDASANKNYVNYWKNGNCLVDLDDREVLLSSSNKSIKVSLEDEDATTNIFTKDFYSAVNNAQTNGELTIHGGDSDGSLWILDAKALLLAKEKKLTLILADRFTDTKMVMDASHFPNDLSGTIFAGYILSESEDAYELKIQVTNDRIPFTIWIKTDGVTEAIEYPFPNGIAGGDEWSCYVVEKSEENPCKNGHQWSGNEITSKATQSANGQMKKICSVCKEESVEVIPRIGTTALSATSYLYTGSVQTPALVVKDVNGKVLSNGTDYSVVWSSGRKNVGKYTVKITFTGKYNGVISKSYVIYPKAVSNFSAIRYQYGNKIRLSWTESKGATGYYIYRKKGSSSKYTYLGSTKQLYYNNGGLSQKVKYQYKIVPYYKANDGEIYYRSDAFKTLSISTVKKGKKLATVSKVKVSKSGSKVKVRWKNVSGESGYQISRSTSKNGTNIVSTYKTTRGTTKKISAAKKKTYYYKVRAYRTVNGKKIYGPWSSVVKYKRK